MSAAPEKVFFSQPLGQQKTPFIRKLQIKDEINDFAVPP